MDDAKVKLYLQGGDEIDGPGELEKDDVVWVAFTGSHYKEKRVETDAALPSLPPQPPDVPPQLPPPPMPSAATSSGAEGAKIIPA